MMIPDCRDRCRPWRRDLPSSAGPPGDHRPAELPRYYH